MKVYVMNDAFETIAIIENFKSLIWTDRFQEAGDFELVVPASLEAVEIYKQNYYLWNSDSEHVMIIEQIEIESNAEDGDLMTLKGRSLESLLDRRIIWGERVFNNKSLQNSVKNLLNEAFIKPKDSKRKIDNFIFKASEDKAITDLKIDVQYDCDNIYDVIVDLCADKDIGFRVLLTDDFKFEFSLYTGIDRTWDQTDNLYVVFSSEFNNIVSSTYLESDKKLKNIALVTADSGEKETIFVTVGSAKGLNRREMHVTGSVSSSGTDDSGESHTMTDDEKRAAMKTKGKEELAKNKGELTFDGKFETTKMYVYGRDFTIGDIVQFADGYTHENVARITEFIISYDESEQTEYPTLKALDIETDEEEG